MADTAEGAGPLSTSEVVVAAGQRALRGNLDRYGEKLAAQGKLFVRERLALLLDEGSFVEDGLLANAVATDLAARGVSSAVEIQDSSGAVISRFALDLPLLAARPLPANDRYQVSH